MCACAVARVSGMHACMRARACGGCNIAVYVGWKRGRGFLSILVHLMCISVPVTCPTGCDAHLVLHARTGPCAPSQLQGRLVLLTGHQHTIVG
jgi:hypothetical protein